VRSEFDHPSIEQAAYHGAGHALALLHLGWDFDRLAIDAKNISERIILPVDCPCWCEGAYTSALSVPLYLENRRTGLFRQRTEAEIQAYAEREYGRKAALLFAAGPIAELIYDGDSSPFVGPYDSIFGCSGLITHAATGRHDLIAINKYRKQAWSLVKKQANWRAIQALAAILIVQHEISGKAAFAVLSAVQGREAPALPASTLAGDERVVLPDYLEDILRDAGRHMDDPKDEDDPEPQSS
jgi:hypothetical protein